ncbi:hypothetical protein [Desulfocurvus vexinensis]|uniref:hypothetical protein n=1 Tax=Desulfocurvus vexinensis TaxID=399548 RepID=UPI00048FA042|nr:hypothetical protein [Desulfocurvus vexinensis]
MKELLLAMTGRDAAWVAARLEAGAGRATVFAPTLEARLALEARGVPHRAHEALAWGLDKHALFDRARRLAWEWFQAPGVAALPAVARVASWRGYPLLAMHQSWLLLSLKEVLEARAFMAAVLDAEAPDRVVLAARGNPFGAYWLQALTGDGGLEPEAARALCRLRGLDVELVEPGPGPEAGGRAPAPRAALRALRRVASGLRRRLRLGSRPGACGAPCDRAFLESGPGPGILMLTWGGYYLHQLLPVLEHLRGAGARLAVGLLGGNFVPGQRAALRAAGVACFHKPSWSVPGEAERMARVAALGAEAMDALRGSTAARAYFEGQGCGLDGPLELALGRELTTTLPETVRDLARAEAILDAFAPDVLVSQFALQPLGLADVLPARLRGVATLNIAHGNPAEMGAVRNTFATARCTVPGARFQATMERVHGLGPGVVRAVGELRLEALAPDGDPRTARLRHGLDPERPVCVFCDMSGWTTKTTIWRHCSRAVLRQALALMDAVPGLQLVYRVHHGADYTALREHLRGLGRADLHFQISPDPLLTDVVRAADVVVAQNCSAITEALACGVRVVFNCVYGDRLPSYAGFAALAVADTDAALVAAVRAAVAEPMAADAVRALARPYYDAMLHGLDGGAAQRQARAVLDLAADPGARTPGFADWAARLEASCRFASATLSGRAACAAGEEP